MPSSFTQEWLNKAEEDEQVTLLVMNSGGPWGMAAYHIQQTTEKFIKAALVEAEVAPPKTHDLEQLLQLHPTFTSDTSVQQAASMLSAYAWLSRYPGVPVFSMSDIDLA